MQNSFAIHFSLISRIFYIHLHNPSNNSRGKTETMADVGVYMLLYIRVFISVFSC